MPKNIVVLSDGTGQEGGKLVNRNTNVYKLFNMLEDRTPRQIVFYDPGIGTGERKLTGYVGGAGLSRNVLQAYRFIFDHYEADDRIFLLGFSRGATTVCSLCSFIEHFGILPKGRPDLIRKAYKIYKTRAPLLKWWAKRRIKRYPVYSSVGWPWMRPLKPPLETWNLNSPGGLDSAMLLPELRNSKVEGERAKQRADEFRKQYWSSDWKAGDFPKDPKDCLRALRLHRRAKRLIAANHTQRTKIHFLGCFDTVAALGLPFRVANAVLNRIWPHRFHNLSLSPRVLNAYQALAIDDRRKVFEPKLWDGWTKEQQVHQVWFAGMHTDVGGGYKEGGLADIPLVWMLRKAHDLGLLLFRGHRQLIAEDETDVMHDSRGSWLLRRLYTEKEREAPEGEQRVHESVRMRSEAETIKVWRNGKSVPERGDRYRPWIRKRATNEEPWERLPTENWLGDFLYDQEEKWKEFLDE